LASDCLPWSSHAARWWSGATMSLVGMTIALVHEAIAG
jgi:hypothetical protein